MLHILPLVQLTCRLVALALVFILIAVATSHGLPLHMPALVKGHSSTTLTSAMPLPTAQANAAICRPCYLMSGFAEVTNATLPKGSMDYCCGLAIEKARMEAVPELEEMPSVQAWKDCYVGQESLNTLRIGIALTTKAWNGVSMQEKIHKVLTAVGRVNGVYERQMSIRLVVGYVYISMSNQTWDNPFCHLTGAEQYAAFQSWAKPSEHALWQLVDDCDDSSVIQTGFALHGTVCTDQGVAVNQIRGESLWLTIARNVGTNLDANPTLRRGGIMDMSNPKYQGLYQFHPDNAIEICSKVESLRDMSTTCTSWSLNVNQSSCEDTPPPTTIFVNDEEKACKELKALCKSNSFIEKTCPATCGKCIKITSQRPTLYPTPSPRELAFTTYQPSVHTPKTVEFLADGGGISDGSLLPCKIPFNAAGRTFTRCAQFTEATPALVDPTSSGSYPYEPVYGTDKSKWCVVGIATYSNDTADRSRMWGYCRKLTKQPTLSPRGSETEPLTNATTVVSHVDYRFLSFIPLLSIPALALRKKLRGCDLANPC